METSNQVSVDFLLDKLCKSIYKDANTSRDATTHRMPSGQQHHDTNHRIPDKLLKKCKLRSYEILLKKSDQRPADEGYSDIINPIRELKFNQFEYNLYVGQVRPQFNVYGQIGRKQIQKILKKLHLFEECVKFVQEDEYFRGDQSEGYLFLWFLILMKNHSSEDVILKISSDESYFSLQTHEIPKFPVLEPKRFELNWHPDVALNNNPYCSSMRQLNGSFCPLKGVEDVAEMERISDKATPFAVDKVLNMIRMQKTSQTICYTSNKWENAGKNYDLNTNSGDDQMQMIFEKKFCTELPQSSVNLMAIQAYRGKKLFEARLVPKKQFIQHIKLLLIGIESESFVFNERVQSFRIVENLTVDNLMPSTINHFVEDFLECGTCYKQFKALIQSNIPGLKLERDGFLFKSLHASLDKYLEMFRRTVIINKQDSISSLLLRVSPLIKQIRILAKVLAIHPTDTNDGVLHGSEFLGYLYREIIGLTQKDISFLLLFMFSRCCAVYFRHFSTWIYHGIVDDPGSELFIEFANYYVPKTKFFFDKAFVIKRQSVPGFLQGWEESILLCGKYSNLLKLYNPTHPLLAIDPPQIVVCLSFNQLKEAETKCEKYRALAQSVCGRPFLVADLLKNRAEKRSKMAAEMAIRSQISLENWKIEQNVKNAKRMEQREKDRVVLLQQIQEIHDKKVQKRREQLEEDRAYLRQCELADLELEERENERRRKNIEYYTELGNIVDAQRKRTEEEIALLKGQMVANNQKASHEPENEHESSDESDNESVYYDADKSPQSKASCENVNSPDDRITTLPRSKSDLLNANSVSTENLISDRAKNKANVLTSNFDLAANIEETIQPFQVAPAHLTDAQKNKMKMFRQEYDFTDANANSNEVIVQTSRVDLTDLQKNRAKVLSAEFGITGVTVDLSSENQIGLLSEFEKNKRTAQGHGHTFGVEKDVNANRAESIPLTDLQINRKKNLEQEFGLVEPKPVNEAQKKLKASLSLDLDSINGQKEKKKNQLSPKPCQSDFFVSPMSTTSDDLLACPASAVVEPEQVLPDEHDTVLKLDCTAAMTNQINFEQFSAEIDERPTPLSALNSAGIEMRREGFLFAISHQPTFKSTNFFDLSPHLSSNQPEKATQSSPINQPTESLSLNDLQELSSANLTHFLQQSFIIPLQVQFALLNNEMLKIFFVELDILGHFNSLRNYFFMMDGEFACNISDGILNKLESIRKPRELLNSHVLHTILENALQSSLMGNDKNAENLSFCIPNVPDKFDMASPNVLNELHLSYKVQWPLNLLISEEAIDHYDKVFQHLLKLRRITWLLEQSFYKLKDIRKQSAEKIQQSPQFRHVQQIRHKLLCFVNALQNHITSVALQGSWQIFQEDLKSIKSMQDLYRKHTKYLKRVKFLCMLNRSSQEFYSKIEDVFIIILRFCSKLQSKNWQCGDSGIYTHPKYEKLQVIENDFTNLIKFIIYAGKKMSQCGYQTEISEFIYIININGYYDSM